MLGSEERLIELAGAIVDGTPVDWPSELASPRNADDQKIIEQLQAIAALASVHRSPDDSTHDLVAEDHSVRTSWGPLQLRRVIGRGSFGTIYLAWDPGLEREVVVKIMERSNRTHAIFQDARIVEACDMGMLERGEDVALACHAFPQIRQCPADVG